jgi:hypothetical protein
MWLALALACAGSPTDASLAAPQAGPALAPPPAPGATPGTPAHEACVEDCVRQRQMVAESIEAIRAKCSADCDAAHDPPALPP